MVTRTNQYNLLVLLTTIIALTSHLCAAGPCKTSITGITQFDPEANAFFGTATFAWSNGDLESAAVSTFFLAEPKTLPNGLMLLKTMHVFDFGDDDVLFTHDHVILFPTVTPGAYVLHSSLAITGGTGRFTGAVGHIHTVAGSSVNLFTGQANPVAVGNVCVP